MSIDIRAIQNENELDRFLTECHGGVRAELIHDERKQEGVLGFEFGTGEEESNGFDFWFTESTLGTVDFYKFVGVCDAHDCLHVVNGLFFAV